MLKCNTNFSTSLMSLYLVTCVAKLLHKDTMVSSQFHSNVQEGWAGDLEFKHCNTTWDFIIYAQI